MASSCRLTINRLIQIKDRFLSLIFSFGYFWPFLGERLIIKHCMPFKHWLADGIFLNMTCLFFVFILTDRYWTCKILKNEKVRINIKYSCILLNKILDKKFITRPRTRRFKNEKKISN